MAAKARTSASDSKKRSVRASASGSVVYAFSSHAAISFRTVPTSVATKKANSGRGSLAADAGAGRHSCQTREYEPSIRHCSSWRDGFTLVVGREIVACERTNVGDPGDLAAVGDGGRERLEEGVEAGDVVEGEKAEKGERDERRLVRRLGENGPVRRQASATGSGARFQLAGDRESVV